MIFSVNLPLVFIYKLSKKEIQLQPQGEPNRVHRLGEVLQGRSKSKFNIILSFFILYLPLVFIFKWYFDKFQNQPPGEPLKTTSR